MMSDNPKPARPRHRQKADPGECAYCDSLRERGESFHPPHDVSSNCESGRRDHCSCDRCF